MERAGVLEGAGRDAGDTFRAAERRAKSSPVAPRISILRRPRLEEWLNDALGRRLTLVIGDAGFGKSTLVGQWASGVDHAWHTLSAGEGSLVSLVRSIVASLQGRIPSLPMDVSMAMGSPGGPDALADELGRAESCAALLCETLWDRLTADLVLVLDDVHEIGDGPAPWRFIESLCRHAPLSFHLVLCSRGEPQFSFQRLRGQGQVLEITGRELAFERDEVASLLTAAVGEGAATMADAVDEVTEGWPAAVRLAVEALRRSPEKNRMRTLHELERSGGDLFAYLADQVFGAESGGWHSLVRTIASFDKVTADLCEELGFAQAAETLSSLVRRGLFRPCGSATGWFSVSALLRQYVLTCLPLKPDESRDIHRRAAEWFESQGHFEDSLRCLEAIADHSKIVKLLTQCGAEMLTSGSLRGVIRAGESVPLKLRNADVERLLGEAQQIQGDWDSALKCFERAAAKARAFSPGVAWRIGLVHHFRGEVDKALRAYESACIDGSAPNDEAQLLAWQASACWLRGDVEGCCEKASKGFEIASTVGDCRALAAAHTALAMLAALRGDRSANDTHYLRALEYAERVGDILQVIRIRTNRGSQLMEEGSYDDAIAELDVALRLSDLVGFACFRALAFTNRGEALCHLGRLEDAFADLEAARALYQKMGSRDVSYPLRCIGDIYRERGDLSLARAAYEEAITHSEQAGDVQCLVPSLAGAARVLVRDDPERAAELARRAVGLGPGMGHVAALLAAGYIALACGDQAEAREAAEQAAGTARARRDRAGLAEALELAAVSAMEPELSRSYADEALGIWRDLGNPLGEARAELIIACLIGGASGRALREDAERRLRRVGGRAHAGNALLASLGNGVPASLEIRAFGRFEVLRHGVAVPLDEWRSRKARDLLKILIARRGRPCSRELLMELLWPGEDPDRVAHRLSVALSTLRGVLDPDRAFPTGRFVVTDHTTVSLDLAHLVSDTESFLENAAKGLWQRDRMQAAEARLHLTAAEAAYVGDFLEEDPYEDWAVPLREEARAAYVRVVRALAEDAISSGDRDVACRYFMRILERDPYDEQIHLGLVSTLLSARRHGEARRCFRTYSARMEEIGVESLPFSSLTPVANQTAS